jgi:hypothetical protein
VSKISPVTNNGRVLEVRAPVADPNATIQKSNICYNPNEIDDSLEVLRCNDDGHSDISLSPALENEANLAT